MAENGNNQVLLLQNKVTILRMVHNSLALLLGILQVVRESYDEKKSTSRFLLMIAFWIVCAARYLLWLYTDANLNQNIEGAYRQHRHVKKGIGSIMLCVFVITSSVVKKMGGVVVLFLVIVELVFYNFLDDLLLPGVVAVEQNNA